MSDSRNVSCSRNRFGTKRYLRWLKKHTDENLEESKWNEMRWDEIKWIIRMWQFVHSILFQKYQSHSWCVNRNHQHEWSICDRISDSNWISMCWCLDMLISLILQLDNEWYWIRFRFRFRWRFRFKVRFRLKHGNKMIMDCKHQQSLPWKIRHDSSFLYFVNFFKIVFNIRFVKQIGLHVYIIDFENLVLERLTPYDDVEQIGSNTAFRSWNLMQSS
jgi:hypothetical protein